MDIRLRLWGWKKLCRGFIFIYFLVIVGIILLVRSQGGQILIGGTTGFRAIEFVSRNPLLIIKAPYEIAANNSNMNETTWRTFMKHLIDKNNRAFDHWLGTEVVMCDNKFFGYNNLYARLHNVTIDPAKGQGRSGGENISEVFNQPEDAEYFKLQKGYFALKCPAKIQYLFKNKDHLKTWLDVLDTDTETVAKAVKRRWTIAVMRYEYANLYHTMTDYYNAFLMTVKFNLDPAETDILFIDGHPKGALDSTWHTLFRSITRAGTITEPVLYTNLIWNILGYYSPLNEHDSPDIPLLESFRQFFLSRHGVNPEKKLSCDNLSVLFLWRRDYLAHPRNPSGKVSRKIKNEDELVSSVQDLLPGHDVRGIQIDKLTMAEQLQMISETDILIGMHGAGLSHTLFLPIHAGLIELFPTYWPSANKHFRAMAQWRHLHYLVWANTEQSRELPDKYTLVDKDAVVKMVHEMHHKICGDHADD